MTYATSWVCNIANSSWDQMHMAMHYSLTCCFTTVHANAEANDCLVRVHQDLALLPQQSINGIHFGRHQAKVVLDMALCDEFGSL
jgi:hypothetical protein